MISNKDGMRHIYIPDARASARPIISADLQSSASHEARR